MKRQATETEDDKYDWIVNELTWLLRRLDVPTMRRLLAKTARKLDLEPASAKETIKPE